MSEGELLEPDRLGTVSRALAVALFSAHPELRSMAQMTPGDERDGLSLLVEIPSPTGDPDRAAAIWLDESVPSIDFGDWHSHGDVLAESGSSESQISSVIELLGAIMRDEFVLISDVGGEFHGHTSVLDLRDPNALEDELTSPYSPGHVQIRSWSGARDRNADLASLDAE